MPFYLGERQFMKDIDYYQILSFSDMYLVNEIYRRIDDQEADIAYKKIQDKHLKPLTVSKRIIEYIEAGYLGDLLRKTFIYFIIGYFIGISYYLINHDFFNVSEDMQRTILFEFKISSLHVPVLLFVVFIFVVKIVNYYRRNKKSMENVFQNEKTEIKEMTVEQAYRSLLADENDEFSYIKKCLVKEIARNKYAIQQKIDAYLIIAKNYQKVETNKVDMLKMIVCYMRNVVTCLVGMFATTAIIVPFLYYYINWLFGVGSTPEQTQLFLEQASYALKPIHDFVLTLPFGEAIPLINDYFGMFYALVVILGLVMILYELPRAVLEFIRHFYRSRNYACKIKMGIYERKHKFYVLKDISHNKYSNKFKMFFVVLITASIIYYVSIALSV